MHQLIEAALEHAEYVRECALGDDDYGQRVTVAEANAGKPSQKRLSMN
jgi:hypothetical protein